MSTTRNDERLTPPQPNGATVVWLHAGALMLGSPADHTRHGVARYVDAGYTVLCLDYPLVPPTTIDGRRLGSERPADC